MKYGTVPGIDLPISRIVQGSIQVNIKDDNEGFALMDAALERGINSVDSAYIYGGGATDRFIGRWMAARGNRDKVAVLAKGAHPGEGRNRVTPYDIGSELHDTLSRMKTDYVDMYVLHRDDPAVPVGPIVDVLNQYVKEGKIRAFGGSNWSVERLQEANAYATETGQLPFAISSPNFSLADQIKEPWGGCLTLSGPSKEADRKWYAESGMAIFAWSSMAGGFWSGRYAKEKADDYKEGQDKLVKDCYFSDENFQRLERAKELGDAKGLSIPQIALAYVLNYRLNIFALVGSANASELDANMAAANTELTEREMAYLDLRADSPK